MLLALPKNIVRPVTYFSPDNARVKSIISIMSGLMTANFFESGEKNDGPSPLPFPWTARSSFLVLVEKRKVPPNGLKDARRYLPSGLTVKVIGRDTQFHGRPRVLPQNLSMILPVFVSIQ